MEAEPLEPCSDTDDVLASLVGIGLPESSLSPPSGVEMHQMRRVGSVVGGMYAGLYEAADISLEIFRWILALEKQLIPIGGGESENRRVILEFKELAWMFRKKICQLSYYGQQHKFSKEQGRYTGVVGGLDCEEGQGSQTGLVTGLDNKEEQGRQTGLVTGLDNKEEQGRYTGPVAGLDGEEEQGRLIGKLNDQIPEETAQRLARAIMLKYEAQMCDLAWILKEEKTPEAEVALRFGLNLELLGKDIDELRRELWRIVSSFSPENTDVLKSMTMLAREPCLHGIAKLRWISEQITMLLRMDLDLDSEVKSTMLKLKSETYLSSIANGERSSGGRVAEDENTFAAYRLCWERTWGNDYSFEDMTLLSPMQYTHCMPSRAPVDAVAGSTLQIYSIKLSAKGVDWPLKVYGVVTARDCVDRQRNPVFIRTRNYCQVLTEKDPFLKLTGPVRAIVAMDAVYIEIELKKKGRRKAEDVVLASTVIDSFKGDKFFTCLADNNLCTIELCFQKLEQSVQATIVSAVVTGEGSVPFPYGGKILCCSLPCSGNGDFAGIPSRQAVVFNSANGKLINDRAGHLDLQRRVHSVELGGALQFHVERYSQFDSDSAETGDTRVLPFTPEKWNISKKSCTFADNSEVEITIAWSLIPSKMLS